MASKKATAKKLGFDSPFEMDLANSVLRNAEYHPDKIEYTMPETHHTYTTDFRLGPYFIEVKGFLRREDKKKYVAIANNIEQRGYKLIFVMKNPEKKMAGSRKRKDGTYLSHKEWLEKNGVMCYNPDELEQLLKFEGLIDG